MAGFVDEGLVNVRNDTTTSDSSFDESIELFVTANSELKMPGCDTLHFKILARVTSELQDFRGQILQNSGCVNGRGCADASVSG